MTFVFALATAHAAPVTDWKYRVRPDDTLWDLAGRYLKQGIPWAKLKDYNKVADPFHLQPGTTLSIPVPWLRLEPAKANVVAVRGHVMAIVPGSEELVPVVAGMTFGYGVVLRTQDDGSLTLEFADASRILVQGNSELQLDRLSAYGDTGMVDTRVHLQYGSINSDVTPMSGSAARFNVSTPGTVSSVRGTHFRVSADATDDRARTEVTSGHVDVGNDRRHVLVDGGLGVATVGDAAPGQPAQLLPAPELACPDKSFDQLPFTLHWQQIKSAQHYRVQVSPSARFETLIWDRVVDDAQANLQGLGDGTYAVRVRGIGADRLEGLDATCVNLVIDSNPQPPLIVSPQPGVKLRDTRPQFRWTENQQATSYTWQLADDVEFDHVVAEQVAIPGIDLRAPRALPIGRYYWRVASRDAAGKVGPYTPAILLDVVSGRSAPQPGEPEHRGRDRVLSWPPVGPEQHYQVQFSHEASFGHPTVDTTVDRPEFNLGQIPSGRWYLRVRAVDVDGYAGPWSNVQRTRTSCRACWWVAAGGGATLLWLLLL